MNYLNGGRWALVDEFTEVESGKRNDRPEPRIAPNRTVAHNLAIKCENPDCHFTRDRDLPILVVDEPIYRRLPVFLIATVDKFAALPWVGSSGAFFGHVDRVDAERGFYAAAEPGEGRRLDHGHKLDRAHPSRTRP
jgi:hypothetical protein